MINEWMHTLWRMTDVPDHMVKWLAVLSHSLLAILVSAIVYLLVRRVISPVVTHIVSLTRMKWDDIMFGTNILKAISLLIFAMLLQWTLPPALVPYPWLMSIVAKVCEIFLIVAIVRLINFTIEGGYALLAQNERLRMQPLKGLMQMLKLIVILVGIIIGVSTLLDKNPAIILTSLGASAAVLMLVFKDTILGVVAGVQLSANDMLRKGDWIVVPGTPVNGVVEDVTLTTVKVQNFDNTTLTVPPYTLVSGAFQNWRGMTDSGGRRIMRSVIIDSRSVRFMTADETAAFADKEWMKKVTDTIDDKPVNLTAFRYYLEDLIERYQATKDDFIYMVRQLDPTPQGIPMQVYFFTTQTDWKEYEHIQADLFDHIYAMINTFGLRVYQAPSSSDISELTDLTRTGGKA